MPSAYPVILADQLRATAELLRLPEHAVASALVFMHRFKKGCGDFDMADDVCLFASSFTELTAEIPWSFRAHSYHLLQH